MTDRIFEHKKGRVWQLVARQERQLAGVRRELAGRRYQVRVLQARVRRARQGAS